MSKMTKKELDAVIDYLKVSVPEHSQLFAKLHSDINDVISEEVRLSNPMSASMAMLDRGPTVYGYSVNKAKPVYFEIDVRRINGDLLRPEQIKNITIYHQS